MEMEQEFKGERIPEGEGPGVAGCEWWRGQVRA